MATPCLDEKLHPELVAANIAVCRAQALVHSMASNLGFEDVTQPGGDRPGLLTIAGLGETPCACRAGKPRL